MKTQVGTERTIRNNFVRSSGVVVFAFLFNAVINVLFLGWLARKGGMSLIGSWSLLNAFILYVVVADFGFTNALVRHVALNGVVAAIGPIRWLVSRLAILWATFGALFLTVGIGGVFDSSQLAGVFLSVTAGALQLISNWVIALRLGQHEQFWFNIKTVLRVMTQILLAFLLYSSVDWPAALVFGCALCIGGAIEAAFSIWLVSGCVSYAAIYPAHRVTFREMVELARGFGVTNVLQRIQQPVWQSLVAVIGGASALGAFTIALRIPVVLSQAVGETMRVLLPGLSQLQREGNRGAILRSLRDGVLIQVLLIGPVFIVFAVEATDILRLWLGRVQADLLLSTRILTLGLFFGSIVAPYIWALQAFGDAGRVAMSVAVKLAMVVTIGAVALWWTDGSMAAFSLVFAAANGVSAALVLRWSAVRWHITAESLSLVVWPMVMLMLGGVLALCFAWSTAMAGASEIKRLAFVAGGSAIPYGVALMVLNRRRVLIVRALEC